MHGKSKVKISELEQEKKKKEREAKVKIYRQITSQLWEKRRKGEFDSEALNLITEVLSRNPDIYTLWNFRRQILTVYLSSKSNEELSKILSSELNFTESCIKVNPKSYSAWHHRQWLLEKFPEPNLMKELVLCTLYLKMDERNFHCWDYRRWVASRLSVPDEKELDYTMEKINENFSNYSSWHYRSKLLPRVHPDPAGLRPVNQHMHLNELELVVNAAFTDPNDQSAWFYQRWLLGRTNSSPKPVRALMKTNSRELLLAFSTPISPSQVQIVNCNTPTNKWDQLAPCLLRIELNENVEELEVEVSDVTHRLRLISDPMSGTSRWSNGSGLEVNTVSPALAAVLDDQLNMCNQLLEYEPDSKWTLLTSVHIMVILNRNSYKDCIMKRLKLLEQVDPFRINYYSHLLSKYTIEYHLEHVSDELSLTSSSLKSLIQTQYLLLTKSVDLSNNNLEDSQLCHLICLQSCKTLILDGNNLTSLENLPHLPNLECLSLCRNDFQNTEEIFSHLDKFSLKKIDLSQNPLNIDQSSLNSVYKNINDIEIIC